MTEMIVLRGEFTSVDRINGNDETILCLVTNVAMSGVGTHEFTGLGQAAFEGLITPDAQRLIEELFESGKVRKVILNRYSLWIEPGTFAFADSDDEQKVLGDLATFVTQLMRRQLVA